jgi:hypothetical protein
MKARLQRLHDRLGPPPPPATRLTSEELVQRLEWWLGKETYNRGVFDRDPAFRPAWLRYYEVWCRHSHGWWPLHTVWRPCLHAEVDAARQEVLAIMVRILERQPRPLRFLGDLLAALAKAEAKRHADNGGATNTSAAGPVATPRWRAVAGRAEGDTSGSPQR